MIPNSLMLVFLQKVFTNFQLGNQTCKKTDCIDVIEDCKLKHRLAQRKYHFQVTEKQTLVPVI